MRPATFSARIGGHGVDEVVEKALLVEEAGFDQVWTGDDPFGEPGVVTLSAIALRTSRTRFGRGVLDPVSLHPVQIAMPTSGLQEVSGRRSPLGLGAGSDIFSRRAGLQPAKPVVRTRQAAFAIRGLLAGRSPAGLDGVADRWTEQALLRFPRPTPICVGATGHRVLALTGRPAGGALPLCLPPSHVHGVVERLHRGARHRQGPRWVAGVAVDVLARERLPSPTGTSSTTSTGECDAIRGSSNTVRWRNSSPTASTGRARTCSGPGPVPRLERCSSARPPRATGRSSTRSSPRSSRRGRRTPTRRA
ncbi:LLM class flavin-dependent oxidoreductase [Kineococcus sp. SYSU DK018]|uniref:LLM class flavin-dependent oxidoreductase n=1 Tax=Kineococcus sp. SYSU DK018 TaxID=3383139 RepID=UPI003D7CB597